MRSGRSASRRAYPPQGRRQGRDRHLRDCIDIFVEYGWDWTCHAFREWSVEREGPDARRRVAGVIRSGVILGVGPHARMIVQVGEHANLERLDGCRCAPLRSNERGGGGKGGGRQKVSTI